MYAARTASPKNAAASKPRRKARVVIGRHGSDPPGLGAGRGSPGRCASAGRSFRRPHCYRGASMAESTAPAQADPSRRGYHLEIFLVSFAALLLEVSYTRIVSFKLFYYYTYLVIGLALLGIGTGGVLVAVSKRLKRASTDAIMLWGLLLGALSIGVGYLVVAKLPIATNKIWDYGSGDSYSNLGRLLIICLSLFASFIAVGIMLATLF